MNERVDPSPGAGGLSLAERLATLVRREPLVHFLGLAALLFVAGAVFSGDDREIITVDVPTQEFLIKQEEDLRLRPLTDEEQDLVVQNFVDDEILVREGRRKGLGNSSRIRRLLIQNMRFFLSGDLPQPSEADLRAWFDANIERFESDPSITYDHVYFADPDTIPADVLQQLATVEDHTTIGDFIPVGPRLVKMDQDEVARAFGPQTAPLVLAIAGDGWHGPFVSLQGTHFLRIAERHSPQRPTFEEAERWLEQDWMMGKRNEILTQALAEMRKGYRIEILQPGQEDG